MNLRNELEPKLDIVERLYPQILDLIADYDNAIDSEKYDEIRAIVKKVSELTGKDITEDDLFEYWEADGAGVLAFEMALPPPLKIDKITKDELREIARRVKNFEYADEFADHVTSEELKENKYAFASVLSHKYYMKLIQVNFNYPSVFKLFQRQKNNGVYAEYTIEDIVEMIFSMNEEKK